MVPGRAADEALSDRARLARWQVISTVLDSGAGHVGGPLSAIELLVALYFRVLRIHPDEPDWPDRDRAPGSRRGIARRSVPAPAHSR